jgi:hypothetical protein
LLLAELDGVALFWPAAGVSSGVLIALGRDARLPVASGAMVATIVANLMGDRNVWSATIFAFCNAGEALLTAWLVERYFGSPWSGVGLADLIRHQLAPYTTEANTTISGQEISLTSAQTQAVAMVVHELVTNAAKHGALSGPDGKVSVSWDRAGADAAEVLTITWRELDGEPIRAPVRSRYGTSLIRDLIPHELGGTVELTFPSDGAVCKIQIPLGAKQIDKARIDT